ncbi:MAG: tryptophan-rich sensory protein [Bacilli bacterium]
MMFYAFYVCFLSFISFSIYQVVCSNKMNNDMLFLIAANYLLNISTTIFFFIYSNLLLALLSSIFLLIFAFFLIRSIKNVFGVYKFFSIPYLLLVSYAFSFILIECL